MPNNPSQDKDTLFTPEQMQFALDLLSRSGHPEAKNVKDVEGLTAAVNSVWPVSQTPTEQDKSTAVPPSDKASQTQDGQSTQRPEDTSTSGAARS